MRPVLIVYDGYHGHTAKVADALAAMIRATGHDAYATDVSHAATLDITRFAGVVVGGAIHLGGVSRRLLDFVRRHQADLTAVPTGFFCVCMAAARADADSKRDVQMYLDRFTEESGLTPTRRTAFGGALKYTQYDPVLRFIMRAVARAHGDPIDTTRDHELTDWLAVLRFARRFANELERREHAPIAA